MSAFLLSQVALSNLAFEFLRLHDDECIIVWSNLPRNWKLFRCPDEQRLARIFQILLAQNLRSLRCRYGPGANHDSNRSLDWKVMEPSEAYRRQPVDAPALTQLCRCYDYQCIEDKHYGRSEAAWISRMTHEAAVGVVLKPLCKELPWGGPLDGFIDETEPAVI